MVLEFITFDLMFSIIGDIYYKVTITNGIVYNRSYFNDKNYIMIFENKLYNKDDFDIIINSRYLDYSRNELNIDIGKNKGIKIPRKIENMIIIYDSVTELPTDLKMILLEKVMEQ